jgi:hypothetical protein
MSLIPCSTNCIYQNDGICRLDRITSSAALGTPKSSGAGKCPYFVETSGQGSFKGVIDCPRSNDINSLGNYQL